ncbi:MAG TPA: GntR family transcriptional regulator [Vicinamibacterales bacterium]|jgi:DNA-binding LacI/PurR family transcriptional regulator|nr:GntR family transcriptional regulator [Vicinamibacterales bacterium]
MPLPKYRQVYAALRQEIQSGQLKRGARLASEAELVRRFGASRITVGRAVRELQADGLVERHQGSGTYVKRPPAALSFGLLIPDLGETDIFEPICQGMMSSPLARDHALLWGSLSGHAGSKEERAWHLCRQYIDRHVAGVFFAPLELTPGKDDDNARIVRALEDARIPVVLLDRPALPYPRRGHHDLVGIDNRRAGHIMTEHLLRLGCRQIAFVARAHAAATVDAREAGYREALEASSVPSDRHLARRLDPDNVEDVRALMTSTRAEAIVCANDRTAGSLMHSLLRLRYSVPGDVRIVGIDDLELARLLPVPLTTLRQPTYDIGQAAIAAMLDRVRRTDLPARDILLQCDLVVRQSCGAQRADGILPA